MKRIDPNKLLERELPDPFSRPFALRLYTMIDAKFVTYRLHIPWADATIARLDSPPYWILDLAITPYRPAAQKIVGEFAHSEPFAILSADVQTNEYVVSAYLRYARREISWASFLQIAGEESDANGGLRSCEYFYDYLNNLEASSFAAEVEEQQKREVLPQYSELANSLLRTYGELTKQAVLR